MYTVHISTLWSISVLGKSSHLFASPNMYFFCVSLLWRFNGRIGLLYLISLFLSVGHRPAPRNPIVTVASIHFWRSHVVVQQVFPVGVALQWRHLGYEDGIVYCSEIHTYALWILQQLLASYKHTQKVNFSSFFRSEVRVMKIASLTNRRCG